MRNEKWKISRAAPVPTVRCQLLPLTQAGPLTIFSTQKRGKLFIPHPSALIPGLSGRNSMVECQLPKLEVAGSSPVARSKIFAVRFRVRSPLTFKRQRCPKVPSLEFCRQIGNSLRSFYSAQGCGYSEPNKVYYKNL